MERGSNRLTETGHQRSAREQHNAMVPVVTHSHLKQGRLRSQSKNENYGPSEGIESIPCSTSGKQLGEKNAEHTKRREQTRRGSKHSNGSLAGNILIGSSVGDEKSEGQDYKCDECGEVFRSKDLIERHVKAPCQAELIGCVRSGAEIHTRHEYEKHRSLHCGRKASRRRAQKGVAVGVSGESEGKKQIKKWIPPICHICSKTFAEKGLLQRHVKIVHLKERNFLCDVCGGVFGEKAALQRHMRHHSGANPYTCSLCGKGFVQSGNLTQHVVAVHRMEKPHTCGGCGKAFSDVSHLRRHKLLHLGERPHACDVCAKTFAQKPSLERHMLIHTREKPHACDVCSKAFSLKHHLESHVLTHTGDKPHTCHLCLESFSHNSSLRRHMARAVHLKKLKTPHAREVQNP